MTRLRWLLLLGLFIALAPSAALAQRVHVAILSIRGKGGGAAAATGLQNALGKLRDVTFESAKDFLAEAERRGVSDRVETEPKAMSQVARALAVDAIVTGQLDEGQRSKSKVLTLTVHNGGNGKRLGEEVVEVPGGKLTPKVYGQAARAIEPYIRMGEHRSAYIEEPSAAAPGAAAGPALAADTSAAVDEPGAEPDAASPAGGPGDILRIQAGLAMRSRSFRYKVHPETAATVDQFLFVPDGISYDSSLSPGIGLTAEFYPLGLFTSGPATGLGLVVGYEKIFLDTEQKVEKQDATTTTSDLGTSQSLVDAALRYRYGFGEGLPEVQGTVGMSWSTFELDHNEEYRGTNYRSLHVGAGGRIPLGTPLAAAEVDVRYLPLVDLGDTVEELGHSAEVTGFGVTAALVSEFGPGLLASAGVDYTSYSGDVTGEGRGTDADGDGTADKVRHGKSMEDSYLGIHARVGYHF